MKTIKSFLRKNWLSLIFIIAIIFLFVKNNTLKTEIDLIQSQIGIERKTRGITRDYSSGLYGRINELESRILDLESSLEEINNSVVDLKKRKPLFTIPLGTAGSSFGGEEPPTE